MAGSSTFSLKDFQPKFREFGGSGRIHLEKNDDSGIAVITLKHEEKRNSITGPMIADLMDIVAELEEWTTGKGLILWGGPNTFCSGADLPMVRRLLEGSATDNGSALAWTMHNLLTRLHQLPLVSTALVCGKAIGGGAELTTACDFRLMTSSAEVYFVHTRMGLVTGWGGGTRLVRLLGRTRALEVLVGEKALGADAAIQTGLANGIVQSSDSALQEALLWLQQRTRGDVAVVRATKHIVSQAALLPLDEALNEERQIFAGLWGGAAQLKALEQNLKHR